MKEYIATYGDNGAYREQELIRCKDCKYFAHDPISGYCTLLDFEDVGGMKDKWCAWAERREP